MQKEVRLICSGNGICNVTMTENLTVTAVFEERNTSSVLIENYALQSEAFQLTEIQNNAPGITWHEGLSQYLVVVNNFGVIFRYDVNFSYLGIITVNGINKDTEGLGFAGGNEVMIVSEDNYASKLEINADTTFVNGGVPASQRYRVLALSSSNKDLEGVTVRIESLCLPRRRRW